MVITYLAKRFQSIDLGLDLRDCIGGKHGRVGYRIDWALWHGTNVPDSNTPFRTLPNFQCPGKPDCSVERIVV
jgi:hypothetical protein